MNAKIRKYRRLHWLSLIVFALVLVVSAACKTGDEPGTSNSECSNCGDVYVGLTDADGDFSRYQVDVVSLTLTRADGTVVETLPASSTVDLAQYTDLTEFLTSASVPPGAYVKGTITLDYTNADIYVERNGSPEAAVALDGNGAPAGVLSLQVHLDDSRPLVVTPGRPALLMVDVDLNASNDIDLTVTPIEVTVRPFVVADISPQDDKPLRLRGPLTGVQLADSTYTIGIRPFHIRFGNFGRFRIQTTNATVFNIDGVTYTGDTGLQVLAAKPLGTATVAWGTVDIARRRLAADQVFAGSVVPGGDMDAAKGAVVARSGDTLTLHGAALVRQDGTLYVSDSLTIAVDASTKIRKWMSAGDFSADDISVGQRVTVFGDIDDADPLVMNAANGMVLLLPTPAQGTVVTASANQLDLNLQSLAWRSVSRFDFTGTGATAAQDADPTNYEVDINGLSGHSIGAGDPVRIMGTVHPFGQAPPDFTAVSIADFRDAYAKLDATWNPPAADPFVMLDATGIVVDLENENLGKIHHLRRGGVVTDLADLPDSPTIVPHDAVVGLFCIRQVDQVRVYSDFGLFVSAFQDALNAGGTVAAFHATGGYNSATNTFTAQRIAVRIAN